MIKMQASTYISDDLFDLSPTPLCFLNLEGYFTKVNNALAYTLGYSKEELLSQPFITFVHPEYREDTLKQNAAFAQNKTIQEYKNCYLCADGSLKWLCWNAVQLPDKTCFASASDITINKDQHKENWSASFLPDQQLLSNIDKDDTEKEKWKLQMLRNEHRLLSLIESGNDIILILSPDGVYKFVSPSVRTMLHSDPAYYLGKVTFQFIHPEDLEWVGAEFKTVMETDQPVYIAPFRLQIQSGEWVWVETIATNRLNDPAIDGIVINAKDVSRRIKQEQEKLLDAELLLKQNERLMAVARMNSHELRHPVVALLGLLNLFDKSSIVDKQNRDVIEHLEITVGRLEKVVQRINDTIME